MHGRIVGVGVEEDALRFERKMHAANGIVLQDMVAREMRHDTTGCMCPERRRVQLDR